MDIPNSRRPNTATEQFRRFLWPIISRLVEPAVVCGGNSIEALELCLESFKILRDAKSPVLDAQKHLRDWCNLLVGYTTFEVQRFSPLLRAEAHTDSVGCYPTRGNRCRRDLTSPPPSLHFMRQRLFFSAGISISKVRVLPQHDRSL
jgi:hypothetical protein